MKTGQTVSDDKEPICCPSSVVCDPVSFLSVVCDVSIRYLVFLLRLRFYRSNFILFHSLPPFFLSLGVRRFSMSLPLSSTTVVACVCLTLAVSLGQWSHVKTNDKSINKIHEDGNKKSGRNAIGASNVATPRAFKHIESNIQRVIGNRNLRVVGTCLARPLPLTRIV